MKRRPVILIILPLLCGLTLWFNVGLAPDDLPVHNVNTGISYATIQEAIDAPQTQDGHTIKVDAGIYYEHVTVTKSLFLIGEDRDTTIIDGSEAGTVVKVKADNVVLSNFTIQNSGVAQPWTPHAEFMNHGVEVYSYNNATIRNNIIRNNEVGIYEKFSHNSSIVGNLVIGNKEVGIAVHHSKNNFLRDNNMTGNTYHLSVWGASNLDEYIHDIDTSNIVDGKPVYYWVNETDKQVPLDAGHVSLINSTNIRMENISLQGSNLWLIYTTNSTIKNVSIVDIGLGVIVHSSYNTITENLVYNTRADAVYLAHIENSMNNRIFHNNFIRTKTSWKITNLNSVNTWDNGSEGNYWSDYAGEDLNSDGIGDTLLPHHAVDWYPLMKPWVQVAEVPYDSLKVAIVIDDNYIPPYSDPNVSNDHQFVISSLRNAGYNVTVIYETGTYHSDDANALSYSDIRDFNAVIWVGDTKHWDDNATANALHEFYKNGGGILLIGDDATWGQTEPWLNWGQFLSWTTQPNLTHLKTLDNGWVYNHYVNVIDTEHPIVKGIEGVTFSYDLDIDYTQPMNEGEIVLAYSPNSDSIDNINGKNEPVIVAYDGRTKGEGRTITILLVLSRIPSNVAERLLLNSIEWLVSAPLEIDQTFVSDERVDIGSSQKIGFHAKWVNNGSDVVGASIFVNNTEYITNGTGWVVFNHSSSSVGKKTWFITGVNANGVASYHQTVENPSIIWDRVIVTLENNRVNVGNEAIILAFYEYDREALSGSIMLNDTVFTQDILGMRAYKVIGIVDDKYQLTQFTPNEVYVTFDRIKASYQIETLSPGTLKVIVKVQYEYDKAPVVDATVKVNDVNGENLGNGIYEVNLPLWIPYQSIDIEIEKNAFTPMKYNITVYSLGNIALWAFASFSTISAMAFSRAKWIHRKKLRHLRDLVENRKKMSIDEVAKVMNVKRADAEKLLHELTKRRMVEGFFTSDGKTFITEKKLKEEILRSYDEKG